MITFLVPIWGVKKSNSSEYDCDQGPLKSKSLERKQAPIKNGMPVNPELSGLISSKLFQEDPTTHTFVSQAPEA